MGGPAPAPPTECIHFGRVGDEARLGMGDEAADDSGPNGGVLAGD